MKRGVHILAVGFMAGLVGFLLGRLSAGPERLPEPPGVERYPSRLAASLRVASPARPPEEALDMGTRMRTLLDLGLSKVYTSVLDWTAAANRIPAADREHALDVLLESTAGDERGFARYARHEISKEILLLWAQEDPLAAVAYAEAHELYALSDVICDWAARRPDDAMTWFDGHADQEMQRKYLPLLLEGVAATQPDVALARVLQIGDPRMRDVVRRRAAEALAGQDPAALAGRLASDPDLAPVLAHAATETMLQWCRRDREAAIAWALSVDPERLPRKEILTATAADDPDTAMVLAERLDDSAEASMVARRALTAWVVRDPARLKSWLDTHSHSPHHGFGLLLYADSQSTRDPAQACRMLTQIPEDTWLGAETDGLAPFAALAAADPQEALRTAGLVAHATLRRAALKSVLQAWSREEPAAAWDYARNNVEDADLRQSLLVQLARRRPEEALAAAAELPDAQRVAIWPEIFRWIRDPNLIRAQFADVPYEQWPPEAAGTIVRALALDSPTTAAEWTDALPESTFRNGAIAVLCMDHPSPENLWRAQVLPSQDRKKLMERLARGWGQENPLEAFQVVGGLPATPEGIEFVEQVMQHQLEASGQSAAASTLIDALPPGPMQTAAIVQVAGDLAKTHPLDALAWIQEQPSGHDQAWEQILSTWAQTDPGQAIAYVVQQPAEDLERGLRTVLPGLIDADPVRAAGLIDSLPERQLRADATASLVQGWARRDPVGAEHWLQSLPPGPSSQRAAQAFATSAAPYHPELAWAWAQSLEDPIARQDALKTVTRHWYRTDPAAAREATSAGAY
jgi:hypothetical protein